MAFQVLVVEDQRDISSIVQKYLEKSGYRANLAENGFEALASMGEKPFHLVILDIMMPGIDGFEVLTEIRKMSDVPVLMLTAKESEADRIKGFDLGADDYVVKPFSPRELVKRVDAIIRRAYGQNDERRLKAGEIEIYLDSMKAFVGGKEIELTTAEFGILFVFMENENVVLSREQIIQKSFGHSYEGIDRNIDSYIKRIRQKIEDNPKSPKHIVTKYGAGYIFRGELG